VLSPYYGTTIFTVSSVIGVVLAALSVGYYFGGRLADKHPAEKYLFNIILLSGLSVLLMQLLNLFVLPISAYLLSMIWGPLVFSVGLFFLPALLLGMISPYAVTLQYRRLGDEGVGRVSGSIFFWGTVGSLLGTFLTGFYLIPSFGIKNIVTGVALVLLLVGLLGRSRLVKREREVVGLVGLVIIAGSSLGAFRLATWPEQVLWLKDGIYDRVAVVDVVYKEKPARVLFQDATAETAIYLSSGKTALEFNRYYELYKLVRPTLDRALVIGGGAMTVPRLLVENDPYVEVEVVEIEPMLFDLSYQYFNVPASERIVEIVEDGRRYLYNSSAKYDLIYLDAYRGWNVPSHLATEEFLKLAYDRTSDNGVVVANIIGNVHESELTYAKVQMATWRKVWPNSYFFATEDPDSEKIQNIAAVGFKTEEPVELSYAGPVNEDSPLPGLQEHLIEEVEEEKELVYTDDYAPVEWLLARDLQRFGDIE